MHLSFPAPRPLAPFLPLSPTPPKKIIFVVVVVLFVCVIFCTSDKRKPSFFFFYNTVQFVGLWSVVFSLSWFWRNTQVNIYAVYAYFVHEICRTGKQEGDHLG